MYCSFDIKQLRTILCCVESVCSNLMQSSNNCSLFPLMRITQAFYESSGGHAFYNSNIATTNFHKITKNLNKLCSIFSFLLTDKLQLKNHKKLWKEICINFFNNFQTPCRLSQNYEHWQFIFIFSISFTVKVMNQKETYRKR